MVNLQLSYNVPVDRVFYKNGLFVSRSYETAYVGFDNVGRNISFVFNKYFAETLNVFEKSFVFAHESLHVLFNHGRRGKEYLETLPKKKRSRKILNIAMDICINEILIEEVFKDQVAYMPILKDMCLIETIFKNDAHSIEKHKSFQYYYEKILEMLESRQKDEDAFDDNMVFGDALFGEPEEGELGDWKDEILNEIQSRAGNPDETDCEKVFDGKEEKRDTSNQIKKKEQYLSMGIQDAVDRFVKPRNMSQHDMNAVVKTKYSWTSINRRTAAMMNNTTFKNRAEMPNRQYIRKLKKMKIVVYCDVSGSVANYTEKFLHMISSIDTDRCEVIPYVWADKVSKADYLGNGEYAWSSKVGSGTTIGSVLAHYAKEFPEDSVDAVLVLTDGGYSKIRNKRLGSGFDESKWIFFMTEGHHPDHILEKSTSVEIKW